MSAHREQLHRGLEERHIKLMALGTAIGVGLFLGSATAIRIAGPAILLSYLVAGLAIYVIMRALGQMAVVNPVAGSFSRYAQDYISPMTGYITGWNYCFQALLGAMAETVAVGIYMHLWFPEVPTWIWALLAVALVGVINRMAVKAYGEFEFWFAMIKVVTIVLMIIVGGCVIVFGLGNGGVATGISNLWTHGGWMPNGFSGVLLALPIVMFAYQGIEMLGVTAGEARDPERSLARAVNSVFWRVVVFYVGTLFVILSIYPWNEIGTTGSPFVLTFEKLGIRSAAGIINFVVLTAALSACNSNLYGSSRLIYNLAAQKQAPQWLGRLSTAGVPANAVALAVVCLLLGVVLNYVAPEQVFIWLSAVSTFGAIWTWGVILLSHYRFRKQTQKGRTPRGFPLDSLVAGLFLALVLGLIAWQPETRLAAVIGPCWLVMLAVCYGLFVRKRNGKPVSASFSAD
ncbi:amino acid permease [Pseudomonas sp. H11T01]|uniref:amino acid permease n=1 Tax=Pseudomonas sp. H11T01 TaxID=3402749 RepID=UPI003AD4132F